ncbi:MAG: hypothetical protein RIM99_06135 [Cyclobacteriaceae bacterium]
MKSITVIITLLAISFCSVAQKQDDIRDHIPTENLDAKKNSNKRAYRSKKRRYDVIYRPHAKKILYGNPCAVEATRKMGFEYMVESRNAVRSATQKGKFLNNLKVKTKLVLTRSPFWKLILKKKFKKCRQKSGDIVG